MNKLDSKAEKCDYILQRSFHQMNKIYKQKKQRKMLKKQKTVKGSQAKIIVLIFHKLISLSLKRSSFFYF